MNDKLTPQPGDPIAYVCGVPVYSHEGVDWNEEEGDDDER